MIISDFSRILTHLRKEAGITQKKAASDLGVSQSLLSHYEKGIRECGLVFLVRAADYYGVTVDYMLGRSYEKKGPTISEIDDIPDDDAAGRGNQFKGSLLPTLNRKLICNSVTIIEDILSKINNKKLTTDVSNYLMICVYKMFRQIYNANSENAQTLFGAGQNTYSMRADSELSRLEVEIFDTIHGTVKEISVPQLNQQNIERDYPLFAPSLYNLLQNAENCIGARKK